VEHSKHNAAEEIANTSDRLKTKKVKWTGKEEDLRSIISANEQQIESLK